MLHTSAARLFFGFHPPPGGLARSTLQLPGDSSTYILLQEVLHAPHFSCPAILRLTSSSRRSCTLHTSAARRIFDLLPPPGGLARSTLQLPGDSSTYILLQEVLHTPHLRFPLASRLHIAYNHTAMPTQRYQPSDASLMTPASSSVRKTQQGQPCDETQRTTTNSAQNGHALHAISTASR
jgi:hypothetical protein